jgi:hypothetical protein
MKQPLEQAGPPLVAQTKAAAAEELRERALHHQAESAQSLVRVDPAASDPGRGTANAQGQGVMRVVGV